MPRCCRGDAEVMPRAEMSPSCLCHLREERRHHRGKLSRVDHLQHLLELVQQQHLPVPSRVSQSRPPRPRPSPGPVSPLFVTGAAVLALVGLALRLLRRVRARPELEDRLEDRLGELRVLQQRGGGRREARHARRRVARGGGSFSTNCETQYESCWWYMPMKRTLTNNSPMNYYESCCGGTCR